MGTYWEQNIKKIPTLSLLPKGGGGEMAPWVHAGSPHWLPTISIPTSIVLPLFGRGGGHELWELILRCLLCRKDLVQKLEGSTNYKP
jgi:hypothetical protein